MWARGKAESLRNFQAIGTWTTAYKAGVEDGAAKALLKDGKIEVRNTGRKCRWGEVVEYRAVPSFAPDCKQKADQ